VDGGLWVVLVPDSPGVQIEEPVASKPDARQLIRKQLCRLSLSTVLLRLKAPLLAGDTKAEGNLLIPQGLEVEYVFCDAIEYNSSCRDIESILTTRR